MAAVFFYLFATIMIASAGVVIFARNPVHSVLFLILAFCNGAGLFLLAGAEFLAMILIVVYVGAVAVLFLFVVMMLDVDFAELKQGFIKYLPIGVAVGVVVLAELGMVAIGWRSAPSAPEPSANPIIPQMTQHRGARPSALHEICDLLSGLGPGAAHRHDRRDRAHAPSQAQHQASEDRGAERAHPRECDRDQESSVPDRRLTGILMLTIGLTHYLVVAAILFTLGVAGIILNRKNIIVILMSVELILLSVNLNFVAFSQSLSAI